MVVIVGIVVIVALTFVIIGMPVHWSSQRRKCDQLNAANDAAWEIWKVLTDEDREWLVANGYQRPLPLYWQLR
jgi:hypothetical protein